jgi:hypothetical protein
MHAVRGGAAAFAGRAPMHMATRGRGYAASGLQMEVAREMLASPAPSPETAARWGETLDAFALRTKAAFEGGPRTLPRLVGLMASEDFPPEWVADLEGALRQTLDALGEGADAGVSERVGMLVSLVVQLFAEARASGPDEPHLSGMVLCDRVGRCAELYGAWAPIRPESSALQALEGEVVAAMRGPSGRNATALRPG